MQYSRRILIGVVGLATLTLLAGCVAGTQGVIGNYAAGSSYQVNLGRTWSDITPVTYGLERNVRLLTLDGPRLNRLYLIYEVEPGKGMVRPSNSDDKTPVYAADMTSRERVEFCTQSVESLGYLNVSAGDFAAGALGGASAVEFSLTGQTEEGLNISGKGIVAVEDNALNALVYLAPSEHFFELHRVEVDNLFRSAASPPIQY